MSGQLSPLMRLSGDSRNQETKWSSSFHLIMSHPLYRWHQDNERAEVGEEQPTEKSRESRLRREISDLKRLFAEKTLEVDFFKGALQKIEARHRESRGLGEQASATTSGT